MYDFDKCNNTTCPMKFSCWRFQSPRAEIDWYCSPTWSMVDGVFSCTEYIGMPIRQKPSVIEQILKRK